MSPSRACPVRTAGPAGQNTTGHGLLAPEALCNCGCHPLANFVYCQNTAATTVGVSTFALDPSSAAVAATVGGGAGGGAGRWVSKALRYFRDGSPGQLAGRDATSFFENAVLPDGPGGAMYFEVAYLSDTAPPAVPGAAPARSAEIVRGVTSEVRCDAAPLCDAQCAGEPQYAAWKARCSSQE